MPKTEFKDLGFQFSIEIVKNIPIELKNEFKTVLSVIDKELINYYFELKKDPKINYLICIEGNQIGYSTLFVDDTYWNLYEIYIKDMTLDYKDEIFGSQFVFDNPNSKSSCGCGTSFSI